MTCGSRHKRKEREVTSESERERGDIIFMIRDVCEGGDVPGESRMDERLR